MLKTLGTGALEEGAQVLFNPLISIILISSYPRYQINLKRFLGRS